MKTDFLQPDEIIYKTQGYSITGDGLKTLLETINKLIMRVDALEAASK